MNSQPNPRPASHRDPAPPSEKGHRKKPAEPSGDPAGRRLDWSRADVKLAAAGLGATLFIGLLSLPAIIVGVYDIREAPEWFDEGKTNSSYERSTGLTEASALTYDSEFSSEAAAGGTPTQPAPTSSAEVTYLRDLLPTSTAEGGGWGPAGVTASLSPGQTYGEVTFDIGGSFASFEAELRVEALDSVPALPLLNHFEVWIDKDDDGLWEPEMVFRTERPLGPDDPPLPVIVNIEDAQFIMLRAEIESTGRRSLARWGDARLITSSDHPSAVVPICGSTYIVKPGDTPSTIAEECSVSVNDLLEANAITDAADISVGEVLTIPQ